MSTRAKVRLGQADMSEGELRAWPVGRLRVVVAKVGGRYRALDDWCNHSGCSLSGGRLEGTVLVCPCHLIGFDLDTGKNVTSPGIAGDQPAYPIELVDGQLVVELPSE